MENDQVELTEEEQSLLERVRQRDDEIGDLADRILQLEEERRS